MFQTSRSVVDQGITTAMLPSSQVLADTLELAFDDRQLASHYCLQQPVNADDIYRNSAIFSHATLLFVVVEARDNHERLRADTTSSQKIRGVPTS